MWMRPFPYIGASRALMATRCGRALIPNLVTLPLERAAPDDERDTHAYVIVRVRPTFGLSETRSCAISGTAASTHALLPRRSQAASVQAAPALDLETPDALNSDVLILPIGGTIISAADVERVAAAVCDVREHKRDYADAPPPRAP